MNNPPHISAGCVVSPGFRQAQGVIRYRRFLGERVVSGVGVFLGISVLVLATAAFASSPAAPAKSSTLRVGLGQEPDSLDPTLSRTYTGRVILTQVCGRLYDLDAQANPLPQLAAKLPESEDGGRVQIIRLKSNLRFGDGTPFDAHAVKLSLERHMTLKGSMRRMELGPLAGVDVLDPLTVRLRLDRPFAPLIVALADRAGMVLSPAQIDHDDRAATGPICVGPWRFAERASGQPIVVERSPFYPRPAGADITRIVFIPLPDSARRMAALRAEEVDLITVVPPLDIAPLRGDPHFHVVQVLGPGYVGVTFNIANRAGKQSGAANLGTPWASNPKVREAFELSIDRNALNQTALGGEYVPGCTPISPAMAIHPRVKCSVRDVAAAKRLLSESGFPRGLVLNLTVVDDPVQVRIGAAIQSMAHEAGVDVRLKPTPFRKLLMLQETGQFEAMLLGFAGRLDPDSVIYPFHTCRGTLNFSMTCDAGLDQLLSQAQEQSDPAARLKLYGEAVERIGQIRSIVYLYHQKYTMAFSRHLTGLGPSPDGLPRLAGARFDSGMPAAGSTARSLKTARRSSG